MEFTNSCRMRIPSHEHWNVSKDNLPSRHGSLRGVAAISKHTDRLENAQGIIIDVTHIQLSFQVIAGSTHTGVRLDLSSRGQGVARLKISGLIITDIGQRKVQAFLPLLCTAILRGRPASDFQ